MANGPETCRWGGQGVGAADHTEGDNDFDLVIVHAFEQAIGQITTGQTQQDAAARFFEK